MVDHKLHTLLRVAETKSFTQAAKQLSLTQPAVSQHIRQLEAEVGVRIFNRGENELKPTVEGEIVLRYARRILALYDTMQQRLRDQRRHVTSLRVGITHTSESNFVVEALAKYSYSHEGISITIFSDTVNNLYEGLRSFELDLAVLEGRVAAAGDLSYVLLDTDCLVLVVSNNSPLAKQGMVTLEQLKREKMILRLPSSGTRNLFLSHLEAQNLSIEDFDVILEVDNVATIKDLIRRDFGVSILARSACLDELKKGKITVLPVENLSMPRETSLVYHRDFEHMDILKDITNCYNETARLYNV